MLRKQGIPYSPASNYIIIISGAFMTIKKIHLSFSIPIAFLLMGSLAHADDDRGPTTDQYTFDFREYSYRIFYGDFNGDGKNNDIYFHHEHPQIYSNNFYTTLHKSCKAEQRSFVFCLVSKICGPFLAQAGHPWYEIKPFLIRQSSYSRMLFW